MEITNTPYHIPNMEDADRIWLTARIADMFENHLNDVPETAWFHTLRTHLEVPIQERLRDRYLPALQTWWRDYVLPLVSETERTIFLYETRQHPHIAFTILNACYYARGWSLTIYCTPNNLAFIREALGHNADRARICMIEADAGEYDANRDAYNQFLKSEALWSDLWDTGIRYVLMMELDAYLRDFIPDGIEEFDYICSAWSWRPDEPGGGGISIRRVEKMLELCAVASDMEFPHQDCWLSAAICKVGGIANNKLFVESQYTPNPVGVHQWWSFIPSNSEFATDAYAPGFMRLEGLEAQTLDGDLRAEHESLC